MPWKNGGGETTEIAASPEGAGLDAFDWRVSMARVDGDGPFSLFPGIDRTLAILDGEGLRLAIEGRDPVELTRATAPLAFPADAPTGSILLGGPVTDLNVMTRRTMARHELTVQDYPSGTAIAATASVTLVVPLDAPIELVTPEGPVVVGRRDTLRIDRAAEEAWSAVLAVRARLAVIAIRTLDRGR
jgi:hypothetical protein